MLESLRKVATDRHSRLVRNKSASTSLLIIKACLDPPSPALTGCSDRPKQLFLQRCHGIVVNLPWSTWAPCQGPVKTASMQVGVSRLVTKVKAGSTLKACYGQLWRFVTSRSEGSRSRPSSTCYKEALNVDLWLPEGIYMIYIVTCQVHRPSKNSYY